MNKAVFLDRDGVINQKAPNEGGYITRWEDFHLLPGVAQAVALMNRAGFRVIVVSNQRCVAKGLISAAELDAMHQRMCDQLATAGAIIHGVYYCPHEVAPPCACRKPKPGLLLLAASVHALDLTASWMIGDSEHDVQAGRTAGCRTARLLRAGESETESADMVAQSLLEAARRIVNGNDRTVSQSAEDATRSDTVVS